MNSMETTALTLVQQYPPERYNLLLPTVAAVDVTQWHRMSVSLVSIDPDPRKGDVYPVASRIKEDAEGRAIKQGGQTVYEDLYSLARPATDRIGTAAGITYKELEHGGVVKATADYALCQAVGAIRRPDGTWAVTPPYSKEVDLKVIEMEAREKATNSLLLGLYGENAKRAAQMYRGAWQPDPKFQNSQRFHVDPADMARAIEDQIRPQLIQWRKNKLMRAETGARLRVIRGLTGIRLQYTAEELRLPFVVPRIDFTPDYKDPDVRRLMLSQGMAAAGALYGRAVAPAIPRDADVLNLRTDDDIEAEYVIKTEPVNYGGGQSEASAGTMSESESTPAPEDSRRHPAPTTQSEGKPLDPPKPVSPASTVPPAANATCEMCAKSVSPGVAKFAQGKFRKTLCMDCQKGATPA